MTYQEFDRVRSHTAPHVNWRLDEERAQRVAELSSGPQEQIAGRIAELDREWDVERLLEANAAGLTLLSLTLARWHSPRWLLLSATVPAFLLQHALQGWCPPIEIFRRIGVRTRREIDAERVALKALRGDFEKAHEPTGNARMAADRALAATVTN
jgi:hypothetical protein